MKKNSGIVMSAFMALSMAVVGCSQPSASPTPAPAPAPTTPEVQPDNNTPKPGGTVTFAYRSPFKGLLERAYYEGDDDDRILRFTTEALIGTGDDLKPFPYMVDWTVSDDKKTFTFTMKNKDIKWHNGDPLTMEDWKYALEIIAHKDYEGSRYSNVEMIVGADEYQKGTAKEISGIKITDPYTMSITIKQPTANFIANVWSYPAPKKYYEGIAIKDLVNHPKVRQNPIGTGPFKVKKIQPGEFVEMERFDDYWQGKPLLDGVVYKVIDGKMAASLLKNGEIDMYTIQNSLYDDVAKIDNIDLIEVDELAYTYIGFKMGHWDAEKKLNIMDRPKYSDKRLRQAMAYAIDRKALAKAFEKNKAEPIHAPMPPVSWAKAPDSELNTYDYNPEKAKQLLDEAGFKDVTGDGLREDPQGKKFTINYDAMSGTEVAEPRAQAILQFWKEVGLDAKLNGGALKEFNAFYDMVEKDEPSVEVFSAAWGLSADPDPAGLFKATDLWNYSRWVSEESDKLIAEGVSEKAMDEAVRKDIYVKWQKLVNEELPSIFLHSRKEITAKNKRVQGTHVNSASPINDTHKWWVTK